MCENDSIIDKKPNQLTHRVMVGNVPLGGGAPVVVQSMLNAPANDVDANLAQIRELAAAGCEVVRMAIPRRDCLDAFQSVCEQSPLPVVADVHFDAQIAVEAARPRGGQAAHQPWQHWRPRKDRRRARCRR